MKKDITNGPVIGLDGTVYTQDPDKQGWTGADLPKNGDYAAVVKVAPEDTLRGLALAMLAGARAIETNRRCTGATYVRDPFGENDGPLELSYYTAAQTLRAEGERILEMLREDQS